MYKVIILILGFTAISFAKLKGKTVSERDLIKNNRKNDTVFLLREVTKEYYHAVFVEKNRKSRYYKFLQDFNMDEWDQGNYKADLDFLKKRKVNFLKTNKLAGLPKEWIPLYEYKHKYYVYYPSEEGNLGRRIITDSSFVYWYMDGPYPEPFQSVKIEKSGTYKLKVKDIIGVSIDRPKYKQLKIHMIDPKNQISIFEDSAEPYPYRYSLYIPKEKAVNFDVVVNYCVQNKTPEFMFDETDYAALLKGH